MNRPSPSAASRGAGRGADIALAALVGLATLAYLAAFPRDLGMSDESYFLYEAARIRNGEVMYRDIFQFITPLSAYAMALLFRLFGTTIETARISTAALHGAVALTIFAACRRLAVRRGLALCAALAYLAVCQPAWPYASWHWYSTLLTTLLLYSLLGRRWQERPRAAFAPGLIAGALLGVQQQKGLALAAGAIAIFAVDFLWRGRGTAGGRRELTARCLCFAAGAAAVLVPVLAYSAATAGFASLYDALVRWPLQTYRPSFHVRWGQLGFLAQPFAARTYPLLLRFAPLVLLPLALRAALAPRSRRDDALPANANVLLVSAAASVASILYYPDVIHIAFIAPVFLICAAEAADWALRQLRAGALDSALGWALAAAVALAFAPRLAANLAKARAEFPYEHDTAFGRVAFPDPWQPLLIDHLRALLRDSASNELFCYANVSSPYLTVGAHNPTPFQYFLAGTSPPSQTRQVLDILTRRPPPYVLGAPFFMKPNDPVVRFIESNYDRVDIPALGASEQRRPLELYRRKPGGAAEGAGAEVRP